MRVAVVTGGSRGIGKAVALELARRGLEVALLARDRDALLATAEEIRAAAGREALVCAGDVGDYEEMRQAFAAILARFGRIDVLVNAAGINIRKGILSSSSSEWEEVIRTNLTGVFNTCKLAAEVMTAQREGSIVNISSVQARLGGTSPGYSASKAGVHGLSFSLARELAPLNVRVNVVAPGATETDMAKLWNEETRVRMERSAALGRVALPTEIAAAVAFLASSEASFITGRVVDVNGGMWMG